MKEGLSSRWISLSLLLCALLIGGAAGWLMSLVVKRDVPLRTLVIVQEAPLTEASIASLGSRVLSMEYGQTPSSYTLLEAQYKESSSALATRGFPSNTFAVAVLMFEDGEGKRWFVRFERDESVHVFRITTNRGK